MIILMVKMALYIIVSVAFGYMVGKLYSNAKNREIYDEKELKYTKIISEKNATIVKLKNDLRTSYRKIDTINQGYELQSKLLETKEKELTDKIKIIDDKDEIITFLEKKIGQVSKEKV